MHIKDIVLEGFKSYAQRTVISGWDPQFNAVTGLNGSGKSNILDAICFVLGITNLNHVRASNLQDLVYKRGQAGIQKASVSIVFDNSNKETSPIGYAQFDEIVVTRQVVVGGKNKYLVNGHTTQQQVVQNLFQSVQLNVNNPHFLIMQGKITKVLNMKPVETLAMVEEAAGTRMFEERKEKALKTIAKKERKLEEIHSLLQEEIIPKLDKLRSERATYFEFQQLAQDMERTERRVIQLKYVNAHNIKINGESLRKAQENVLQEIGEQISQWETERNRLRDREQALAASMSTSRFSQLQQTHNDLLKKIAQLDTQLSLKRRACNEESDLLTNLNREHEKLTNALLESQERHAAAIRNVDRSEQFLEDKSRDVTNLQDRISSMSMPDVGSGDTRTSAVKQLNDEKALLVSLAVERNSLINRIKSIEQTIARIQPDIARNESAAKALTRDLESAAAEVDAIEQKLITAEALCGDNTDAKVHELRSEQNRLNQEIKKMTEERDNVFAKIAHIIGFDYSNPTPNFDRSQVYGTVASLVDIESNQRNKAGALEMTAGGKLQNVVVSTEDVGSQLLKHGRLRKRVTLIPLNKIQPNVVTKDRVRRALELAPDKINLALDLVRYEPALKSAMEYVFGNTFVCQDADTANRVTFSPQIRTRSVTWVGDVYEPSGVLSGGSKPQSSGLLLNVMRYRELERNISGLQRRIQELAVELSTIEGHSLEIRELKNQLEALQRRRNHFSERLESGVSVDALTNQLREAQKTKSDLDGRLADLALREERTQIKIQELEQEVNGGAKQEKNQLDSLQSRLKTARKEQSKAAQSATQAKVEVEAAAAEIDELQSELQGAKQRIKDAESQVQVLQTELHTVNTQLTECQHAQTRTSEELTKLRREQSTFDTDRLEISNQLKQVKEELNRLETERKEQRSKLTQLRRDIESAIDILKQLESEHNWLNNSSQQFQDPSLDLDREKSRLESLRKRYEQLKRNVNVNVMEMIGVAEKRETELQEKLGTVLRDKNKIEDTISKLDQIKEDELRKTWTKVNEDFGKIFADLLPGGNTAQLCPVQESILSGLEIRVRLGRIWKDSLTELSGGQRSLIALSLVLALLQFKPAPMYILDEVDAALDLSHTQNIGQLIKSRFTNSQFIVVSLKEGMFSNAHVIFKTRFRDGTSTVDRVKGTLIKR